MSEPAATSRRGFLAAAAAAFATMTLAPGVTLHAYAEQPPATAQGRKVRWGILIDAAACPKDCTACVTACATEFNLVTHGRPRTDPQWIRKLTVTDEATGHTSNFPVMCQHCAHPPCVDVCPTGASFQRPDGIVLIDRHICIGCRYCIMACPYGARNFVHEDIEDQKPYAPRGKGTAEACTMCVHRVDEGRTPACVEACAGSGNNAMLFGDLNDPNSEIAKRVAKYATTQIRADLRTDPGLRYQGI
jgi:molybdopterin-containing oxidoreductase family iron-sulfur binding subunit